MLAFLQVEEGLVCPIFIIALAKCSTMKRRKDAKKFCRRIQVFFVERFVVKSPNKERDMDDDLALNEFSARQVKQGSCDCYNGGRRSPNKTSVCFFKQ